MNKSYWIRIALRALGVFAIGLLLVVGLRRGVGAKHQIGRWADSLEHGSSSVALSLPMSIVPFYVDGAKVGKLDTVVVLRHEAKTIDGLRLVANLDEGGDGKQFSSCAFAIESLDQFDLKQSMACTDDTSGMVPFGQVVFRGQNGGMRPLFVHEHDIDHLPWRYHAHDPDWQFDLDVPGVEIEMGDINIDLGDMNIDIDLSDLAEEMEALARELERIEGLQITVNGDRIRIENLDRLSERINERLRERLRRIERIEARVESAPKAPQAPTPPPEQPQNPPAPTVP